MQGQRPLVLTSPASQQQRWRDALAQEGVALASLPLIEIGPAADPGLAAQALAALLRGPRLALFVSPSAVQALPGFDGRNWPALTWAACVGPGTASALRARGVDRIVCPAVDSPQFDSETLWPLLKAQGDWVGARVLILRGDGGRDWLAEQLQAEGAVVEAYSLYRRMRPTESPAWSVSRAALKDQAPIWLLTSSQALAHGLGLGVIHAGATALCTHPRIAAAARAAGLSVQEVRSEPVAVARAWRAQCAA